VKRELQKLIALLLSAGGQRVPYIKELKELLRLRKKKQMQREFQKRIILLFIAGGQRAHQGAEGATAPAQGRADAEGTPAAHTAGTRS
jgi:hypothetical protein